MSEEKQTKTNQTNRSKDAKDAQLKKRLTEILADEPDENPFEKDKEKTFDENLEIIDYDIDDEITANDFKKTAPKKTRSEAAFDLKQEIFSWIKMIIAAALIATIIVEFIIINATVPTGSMESTILPGDRILGSRLNYLFSEPERGDIVVFEYQFEDGTDYVKRIIGLPGETVSIQNGQIYIYEGEKLIEGPLDEPYVTGEWTLRSDGYTFTVPEGSYLVLGDNRNNSSDARYWYDEYYKTGLKEESEIYVKKEQILGKVYFRYWSQSADKFKKLYTK